MAGIEPFLSKKPSMLMYPCFSIFIEPVSALDKKLVSTWKISQIKLEKIFFDSTPRFEEKEANRPSITALLL